MPSLATCSYSQQHTNPRHSASTWSVESSATSLIGRSKCWVTSHLYHKPWRKTASFYNACGKWYSKAAITWQTLFHLSDNSQLLNDDIGCTDNVHHLPSISIRKQLQSPRHLLTFSTLQFFVYLHRSSQFVPRGRLFHPTRNSPGGPLTSNPAYTVIVFAIDTTYAEQALRFAATFIHACCLRGEAVKLSQSAIAVTFIHMWYLRFEAVKLSQSATIYVHFICMHA